MSLKERFRLEDIESEKLTKKRAFPAKEDENFDAEFAASNVSSLTAEAEENQKKLN